MATAAKKMILSSWCDSSFNQLVISRRTPAGLGRLPEPLYPFVRTIVAVPENDRDERLAIASSQKRRKSAAKRLWRTPSRSSKMSPGSTPMRSPSNSRRINTSTRGPAGNGGALLRLGRSL